MRRLGQWVGVAALVAACGLAGCRKEPQGWIPVLEQTSTVFLQNHTGRALAKLQEARQLLPAEPDRAIEALDQAGVTLEELLGFYLPIFEARELTYNAYRELYLGRPSQSETALDDVEGILHEVAKRDPRYYRAVEAPLEHAEKAKLSLEAGSTEARETLNALANELNFIVLKGDLVLTEE